MSIAQKLINSGVVDLNFDDFKNGVKVIYTNETPEVSPEEGNQVLEKFFAEARRLMEENERKEREENLKSGNDYLKNHSGEDGVQTTKSGLQYKVLVEGDGKQPGPHSRVKCHYEGRLIDGTVFDSSYKRGEPAVFGLDQVIPGWTEGLQLMKVGSKYEFTLPSELGYGERGIPGHIPGNSVLNFVVELLDVE
jgi:FKBP-type peptidyl-prolyl cis-trans isomerase FklB